MKGANSTHPSFSEACTANISAFMTMKCDKEAQVVKKSQKQDRNRTGNKKYTQFFKRRQRCILKFCYIVEFNLSSMFI